MTITLLDQWFSKGSNFTTPRGLLVMPEDISIVPPQSGDATGILYVDTRDAAKISCAGQPPITWNYLAQSVKRA